MSASPQTAAVTRALAQIDAGRAEASKSLSTAARKVLNAVLDSKRNASDKAALLYLLAYKLEVPDWNLRRVPPGWRPADKVLAAGLTERGLTLHSNITSFAENMGIKGNASEYDFFKQRPRLGPALEHFDRHANEVPAAFAYVAQRFKESYHAPVQISSPGPDELVYTAALDIANRLIAANSGGHLPQFLVAGILKAFHRQFNTAFDVRTYHPNASDQSGHAAGDIEVVNAAGEVVAGFEVTVRPDWKNRRPDLVKKMRAFGLRSYNVVCLIAAEDPDLGDPARLHRYVKELGQDIAVADIRAFVAIMLQSLDREHRKIAFGYVEEYVRDPRLCGIPGIVEEFKSIMEHS